MDWAGKPPSNTSTLHLLWFAFSEMTALRNLALFAMAGIACCLSAGQTRAQRFRGGGGGGQGGGAIAQAAAAAPGLTWRDCECQCTGLSFVDAYGRRQGNCRTLDNGARWCYARGGPRSTCPDARSSSRFRGQSWSYHACATPRREVCYNSISGGGYYPPVPLSSRNSNSGGGGRRPSYSGRG